MTDALEVHLCPHPDFPSAAVSAISVTAKRAGGSLTLLFEVDGDLHRIAWPPPLDNKRVDELWKHTCFEAFLQPESGAAYTELNFSPSGRWAAYSFDNCRQNMRDFDSPLGTVFSAIAGEQKRHKVVWRFRTTDVLGRDGWRLGLAAVIEATDGAKSYWALAHAPGPPDFHNPDCFIATLPAPARP